MDVHMCSLMLPRRTGKTRPPPLSDATEASDWQFAPTELMETWSSSDRRLWFVHIVSCSAPDDREMASGLPSLIIATMSNKTQRPLDNKRGLLVSVRVISRLSIGPHCIWRPTTVMSACQNRHILMKTEGKKEDIRRQFEASSTVHWPFQRSGLCP